MAQPKSTRSSARAPKQTAFLKVVPKVNTGDILPVAGAAALLQVSSRTIYNLVKAGTIPHARVGRKLHIGKTNAILHAAYGRSPPAAGCCGPRSRQAAWRQAARLGKALGIAPNALKYP